jgi:hypothetical protein
LPSSLEGQERDGALSCCPEVFVEGSAKFGAFRETCRLRQRLFGEVPSAAVQDASPQAQMDTGREWCAVAIPLATINVVRVSQATRRTNLLGIPNSAEFLW